MTFFVNIVPILAKRSQPEFLNPAGNSQDPIKNAVSKYENRPSITIIKKHMEGFPFF